MPAIKASVPEELEEKFASCKAQAMEAGSSEDEAYAICYASVVEGKDADAKAKRKTRLLMKGPQHLDGKKCVASKCDYCDMAYPTIYPTSLTGLAEAREAQAQASAIQSLTYDFQDVTSGILQSPEIIDKAQAIAAEAGVFQTLLNDLAAGLKSLGAKWGARHSKADNEAIQGVHDMAVQLGAMCAGKAKSAFGVCKGLDGNYYGLGVFTNCYIDLDKEIITDAAHKEFCAHLDANPNLAPELWTEHEEGTARKSRANLWDYDGTFFWMQWPLTEHEAKALASVGPLTMSHQFNGIKEGREWTYYRSFEASVLNAGEEANPLTSFETVAKERQTMFSPEKRALMVALHGEEFTAEKERVSDKARKEADSRGIQRKEQAAKDAATVEIATPVAETVTPVVTPIVDPLAVIADSIAKLQQDVTALSGEVKALKAGKDKQIEEAATAKAQAYQGWLTSPRLPVSGIAEAAKSAGGQLNADDAAKAGVVELQTTAPGWENAGKDIQRR